MLASLEKIAEGDYSYLNYMDGKLYGHDDKLGAIIEMNADGTEKKVLYQEGFVAGPWVVSNNIYFEDFDKNSFFRIKEGSGNLKEIEHKEGEWEQWIFSPAKDRDFEYSLWEKGFDLENSQHTEKAVYVLGQIENSSEIDGKLYCYEYGTEEGELLTEGIFQFNIAGNKIYYLISGENKSELCVMRMELDGSGKEKISKIILPEPVKAAGVGVGRDILYLSVALEPTGFEHIWFLVDIETGEYVQVMEDDTFVRPQ